MAHLWRTHHIFGTLPYLLPSQASIMCNESCKCSDCKNFEGSVDRASVLGLHPQLTSRRRAPSEPSRASPATEERRTPSERAAPLPPPPSRPPPQPRPHSTLPSSVRATLSRAYISRSVCSYLVLVLALWGIWGSGRSDQSFCPNADSLFVAARVPARVPPRVRLTRARRGGRRTHGTSLEAVPAILATRRQLSRATRESQPAAATASSRACGC